MKLKTYIVVGLTILNSAFLYAQDSLQVPLKESRISSQQEQAMAIAQDSLELLEHQLEEHLEVTLIDSLWLEQMYSSPLYDSIKYVMNDAELEDVVIEDLPTALLKERLELIDADTPFNVTYNSSLERIIKNYLKNRKQTLSTLMTRAEYYFPMFEEHLDKYDLPLEIKYLAIVESALRPRAKSHVGATGLWQFMYQTGKQFDLDVSSYVDDRQDPIKATEAACKYLSVLYTIFGDWDLALAAYNSGPGNVNKAIRRAGGKRNFWNIRGFLPRETSGYVPAFYATLYLFKYAEEHNLKANKPYMYSFETDTIHIKQQVTFEQMTNFLDVDVEVLQFLNPQYKLDIIPYKKEENYYVRLPLYTIGQFASNEEQLYAFVDEEEAKRETPLPEYVEMGDRIRYKVVSGDYLGKIAEKYGVRVSAIKRWNGLTTNNLRVGQRLTIYPRKLASTPTTSTANTSSNSTPSGSFETYTVKSGDSLWTISQKYAKVSVQNLKEWNNIWDANALKPGMKLKIYKI